MWRDACAPARVDSWCCVGIVLGIYTTAVPRTVRLGGSGQNFRSKKQEMAPYFHICTFKRIVIQHHMQQLAVRRGHFGYHAVTVGSRFLADTTTMRPSTSNVESTCLSASGMQQNRRGVKSQVWTMPRAGSIQ